MNFIPDQNSEAQDVPYYEDAKTSEGWHGQATEKSVRVLQSEISQSIGRLGGIVIQFKKGTFEGEINNRDGYQVLYGVETADGRQVQGRIDIAALPVRNDTPRNRDKSLRMALFMLREALDGTWYLQQLSPGFSALVPFMLGKGDKTISQMWMESPAMSRLLPPGKTEDFVEGEAREI